MTENPGYLKLRKIKAAQQIARTVAQSNNRVFLDAQALLLNLQSGDEELDKLMDGLVNGKQPASSKKK
jgi:prohibitin 2